MTSMQRANMTYGVVGKLARMLSLVSPQKLRYLS
jgi:hypothetical protein